MSSEELPFEKGMYLKNQRGEVYKIVGKYDGRFQGIGKKFLASVYDNWDCCLLLSCNELEVGVIRGEWIYTDLKI